MLRSARSPLRVSGHSGVFQVPVEYIGPIVLRGRLPEKYYNHYLELVDILKCLLSVTNTRARIEQLKLDVARYVERFEESVLFVGF